MQQSSFARRVWRVKGCDVHAPAVSRPMHRRPLGSLRLCDGPVLTMVEGTEIRGRLRADIVERFPHEPFVATGGRWFSVEFI